MKRTTVFMDEALERELRALASRTRRPMASVVREAVEQYVVDHRGKSGHRLGFVAVGRSGQTDTAERHEELLFEEALTREAVEASLGTTTHARQAHPRRRTRRSRR